MMKLFINKHKISKIINKELHIRIDNNYHNRLKILNSIAIQEYPSNSQRYYSIFQEKFLLKNNPSSLGTRIVCDKENSNSFRKLQKRIAKEFKYLGSSKNYDFVLEKIYINSQNYLILQFKFFDNNYWED